METNNKKYRKFIKDLKEVLIYDAGIIKKRLRKYGRRFVKNLKETYLNKICAMILCIIGISMSLILDDATAFVLILLLYVIPLLLSKKNYVN